MLFQRPVGLPLQAYPGLFKQFQKWNSRKLGGQARLSLTIPPNGEPLILMRDNEGYERNIDV
jgi:hypothetical protein